MDKGHTQDDGKRLLKNNPLLKQMKGISSMLKGSSGYWKDQFSNIGRNFCCDRGEIIENVSSEESADKNCLIENVGNIENVEMKGSDQEQENILKVKNPKKYENAENSIITQVKEEKENSLNLKEENSDEDPNNKNENNFNFSNFMSLNKRNWTTEEDDKLVEFINNSTGRNWKKIAGILGNKTSQQCAYRYNKLLQQTNKKKWNRNDDIFLIELTEQFGKNWKEIAMRMPGRTPQEVNERYEKKLDPNLKRSKFDKEEDELIMQLHERYGNQWNEISKYFKDRNASMIKNRFYSCLKKNIKERNSNYSQVSAQDNSFQDIQNFKNNKNSKNIKIDYETQRKTVSYNDSNLLRNFHEKYQKEDSENYMDSDFSSYGVNHAFHNLRFEDEENQKSQKMEKFENFEKNSQILPKNQINNTTSLFFDDDLFDNLHITSDNIDSLIHTNSDFTYTDVSLKNNFNNLNFKPQFHFQNIDYPPIYPSAERKTSEHNNQMIIDDKETNSLSKDLIKIKTDSPILKETEENDKNNFNEQYKNVFRTKKNSFEENEFNNNDNNKTVESNNNINNQNCLQYNFTQFDNEELQKQYKMLEDVFNKVKEMSMFRSNPQYEKLGKKLDEKRDNLTQRLKILKDEYFQILLKSNSLTSTNQSVRNSILCQIEILIELIKTTKLKISLMQQMEEDVATGGFSAEVPNKSNFGVDV